MGLRGSINLRLKKRVSTLFQNVAYFPSIWISPSPRVGKSCHSVPKDHTDKKNLWTSDLHGKCNAQAHVRNTHSLKLILETDMLWLFKPK